MNAALQRQADIFHPIFGTHSRFFLQGQQERLLYRLSISRYRKNLILKGGMLSLAFDMPTKRPTKDIDLLGMRQADDGQRIGQVFREIALSDSSVVLSSRFWEDAANATKWQAFVGRTGLKMDQPFSEVMRRIAEFIQPVLDANGGETWNPSKWRWE